MVHFLQQPRNGLAFDADLLDHTSAPLLGETILNNHEKQVIPCGLSGLSEESVDVGPRLATLGRTTIELVFQHFLPNHLQNIRWGVADLLGVLLPSGVLDGERILCLHQLGMECSQRLLDSDSVPRPFWLVTS